MGQKDQLITLFNYHFDTTQLLLEQAKKLSDEEYRDDLGIKWGSVHEVVLHILATDHAYRVALETGERPSPLKAEEYPDQKSLRQLLEKERESLIAQIKTLTDAEIEETVHLSAGPDRTLSLPRWHIFNHLLFHGMQHQADIASRLTHFGHSPGDLDFIFYR